MTVVKFTRDYQGWATGNQFYESGDSADLPDSWAKICVAEQAAEYVKDESTPPALETPTPKKLGRPKKVTK